MRKHSLLVIILFFALAGKAQQTKLDLRLWAKLQRGEMKGENIPLLVKGNLTDLRKLTAEVGGKYKTGHGNIASVEIPADKLAAFEANAAVQQIGGTAGRGHFLMDTARIRNNVDSVHSGFAPLLDSLKGAGVVIGIIDGGIFWQHKDFHNEDHTSRIKFIWDQQFTQGLPPAPYTYGVEWDWIDMDYGVCEHRPPTDDFGHGTCVAGIAAGNSFSTKGTPYEGQMTGVAPEADIIAVRIKNDDNFTLNVADAVSYIFKKADAMGKPCVINTSIGTYYGSHDGTDLATQMMENLLDESNGRVLVAAGGNAGHIKHHLGYTVPTNDAAITFFDYISATQDVYFDLWADTSNFNHTLFAVGCNDELGTDLGRMPYDSVKGFSLVEGVGDIKSASLTGLGGTLGQVLMQVTLEGAKYHVEFLVQGILNQNYLWRLETTGGGRFDLWSDRNLMGTSNIVSTIAGIPIQYPNYRHADSLKTIVSSWQCSDKVITVGNYSNRAGYLDRDSSYQNMTIAPYNEVVGKRFATSSFGPTRDNRLKPDIMATGSTTIATGDSIFITQAVSPSNRVKVSITQKHIRNGGTSMASPIVAGIAALYLQRRPNASYQEVKDALILTAKKDEFTGSNANVEYGNGKVNGFRAVSYSGFVYGSTDTACLNYNPNATIDTGGCVLKAYGVRDTACVNYNELANVNGNVCQTKVYGCTDPAALNYDSTANVENSNCQYPNVGIGDVLSNVSFNIMPNPFSGQTTFSFINNGYGFEKGIIRITNQLGAAADEIAIGNATSNYIYNDNKLSAGIYYYSLLLDGKQVKTGKLIVQ